MAPNSATGMWRPTASTPIPEANPTPQRLGVHVRGNGVDIAVVAPDATHVDFVVVTGDGPSRIEQPFALRGPRLGVWHGHLPGAGLGLRYGFRVHGPWDPDGGHYHNPAKFLIDPYARGLEGQVELGAAVHAHQVDRDLYPATYPMAKSLLDSGPYMPTSIVIDTSFPISSKPRVPWSTSVIYELHVKGFTRNMLEVPAELRGTYAGLAHPATVAYLQDLGITSLELLPVHAKLDEPFLAERGLSNYWGYSTLSYFMPEPSYATEQARARGAQGVVDEFRGMVSILHDAGIEVILDVVYNHTAEGGDAGPTLSWRGLGSNMYYRHTPTRPRQMIDVTGTGNTVNFDEARSIQMVLDSLRYWSNEMGIDGFRFDLAATLGRFSTGYTPMHPLLIGMSTDPDLSQDKLIAEPWDVGLGGWQTGNFPVPFGEWNDRFRDTARTFWLADPKNLSNGRRASGPNEIATRMAGSADVFQNAARTRSPAASINFVTAHDGFTLADLTTYNHKHNEANLEGNRDGSDNNLSWNHGTEGSIASTVILSDVPDGTGVVEDLFGSRQQSQRNLLATLLFAAGTPMLLAGDEFERTQYGNNNAYCQDSAISWVDWDLADDQIDQISTVRWLLRLRKAHPVLRPVLFATGSGKAGDSISDVGWYTADAKGLPASGWDSEDHRVFQMVRSGLAASGDRDALVIFNGTLQIQEVKLHPGRRMPWNLVMDTSWRSPLDGGFTRDSDPVRLDQARERFEPGERVRIEPLSLQVCLTDPIVQERGN